MTCAHLEPAPSDHPAEAVLGYTFRDRSLLEAALRHRSSVAHVRETGVTAEAGVPQTQRGEADDEVDIQPPPSRQAESHVEAHGEPHVEAQSEPPGEPHVEPHVKPHRELHNERLEFLGDAVLDLTIRDHLFRRYPEFSEGQLTRFRSQLASRSTLAGIARRLRLDRYIETQLRATDGHPSQEIRLLADALEAVIGAVYADSDFERARVVADRLIADEIARVEADPYHGDCKSALQEFWQKRTGSAPKYEVVSVDGPSHASTFGMVAMLGPSRGEGGTGWSKREATQIAAEATLTRLLHDPEWSAEVLAVARHPNDTDEGDHGRG